MAQNNDKKLYRVTNRLGTFYIVATSFDEAANALKKRLDDADYGFYQYREIPSIDHIATESFHFADESKQSFSQDKGNLIIVDNSINTQN